MFMFSTPKTFTAQPERTNVTLTATVTEYNITALNATVIPVSGSVDLNVNQWNTTGNFRKVFKVSGSGTIAVNFTIGDNPANKRMNVTEDGVLLNNYSTDANGYFTFSHSGPWSENKFEITTAS